MPFQFRKEAIEEDLNSNFPSQGQGNPPLYYSLSEVVVPTYSINDVADGTSLPEMLQTAWDFSTGANSVNNTTSTIINNTGFWLVDLTCSTSIAGASVAIRARAFIDDGVSTKNIWAISSIAAGGNPEGLIEQKFVVFLRSGDSLKVLADSVSVVDVWYRQIATLNGTLVNPLGFSAA